MGNTDQLRDRHPRVDGGVTTAELETVLPMVEIYESIEGEGRAAGHLTVFIRVFGCNLRCTWCDTPYSYAPASPEQTLSIGDIVKTAGTYRARHVCLTGGEPLMYGPKSISLLKALAASPQFLEIHVETNGAIDLRPFLTEVSAEHVRYVMDYKLPGSGEASAMLDKNLSYLRPIDELKFVIADEADFFAALRVLEQHPCRALPLFSPAWQTFAPARLAELMAAHAPVEAKLSLQAHKIIWDVAERRR